MANSMFESILWAVTPEMTQTLAGRLGESPAEVQRGLSTATAATLHGMARSTGDPGFIDRLMQTVSRAGSQNMATNFPDMISAGPSGAAGEAGNRLTSLVFGSQQSRIANLVAQHSGLSSGAGSGILKMAGALVLGHLARMQIAGKLNPSTLPGILQTEASHLTSYVPASFLSGLGGTARETVDRGETLVDDETVARGPSYTSNVLHAEGPRVPSARSTRWVAPALGAIIGAAVLGWIIHRLVTPASTTAINETAQTTENAANGAVNNATSAVPSRRVNISLPNGTQLNVPANGVEVRLVQSLQHPDTRNSATTGLNFDRLLFDNNSATLQPRSNEQLDNVAAILKAYPSEKCSLGGYTDNAGDPAANRTLSEQRAENVRTALVQRGVDPAQISAQGYGDENPVADNSTPQGRQLNRRISIRVASK